MAMLNNQMVILDIHCSRVSTASSKAFQGLLQRIEVRQRLQGFVEGDGHGTLHPRQIRHGHLRLSRQGCYGAVRSVMITTDLPGEQL